MRRRILQVASVVMALQAIVLVLLLPGPADWLVVAAVAAALSAAAALLVETRAATPTLKLRRAATGGVDVVYADGTSHGADVLLATPTLVVLRTDGAAGGRIVTVWRDTLPRAEFRRFLATARWARQPAAHRSAV
jgi:hypothetical protein